MNKEAALADRIVDLCRRSEIPRRFRVRDVQKHFEGEYSPRYLRVILANYEEQGDYVKKGQRARFKRVDRGLYELVLSQFPELGGKRNPPSDAPGRSLTGDDLGAMRRRLIRLLDYVEKRRASHNEGVARRVSRLRDEGVIPKNIANWMQTILSARGGTEYDDHQLSQNESNAIKAAWAEVLLWGNSRGWNPE